MRLRLAFTALLATSAAGLGTAHAAGVLTIFTLAGGGTGAALSGPQDVVVAADGSVLIADTINQQVKRLDARNRVAVVAGSGDLGFSGDGGPARSARFQDPSQLAIGRDGSIFVADTGNSRVRVIRPDGTVATVAGTGDQGFSGDGGPSTAARVNAPAGVAVDATGQLLFADTGNHRIRRVATNGTISTVAGTGTRGFSGDGGPATAARLAAPQGLALAADGSLLVADTGNRRVRRVAPDGTISTLAGTGGGGSAGDGGPATAAQLNMPVDVVAHPQGGYFVVEQGGNRVRRVDRSGAIARLAGTGAPRHGGDGKAAAGSYVNAPRGLALLPSGNELLVADTDNDRIRYIAIPGQASRLAFAWRKTVVQAPLFEQRITVERRKRRILVVRNPPLPFSSSRPSTLTVRITTKKPRRLVTTFRVKARAGAGNIRLPARLRSGRRRLAKGHYVVGVTASAGSATTRGSLELVVK